MFVAGGVNPRKGNTPSASGARTIVVQRAAAAMHRNSKRGENRILSQKVCKVRFF